VFHYSLSFDVKVHQDPQGTDLQDVANSFENRWSFPQSVGAIDGSHIPFLKPLESTSDYYNKKGYYSMLMQAVVNYRGIFIDIMLVGLENYVY